MLHYSDILYLPRGHGLQLIERLGLIAPYPVLPASRVGFVPSLRRLRAPLREPWFLLEDVASLPFVPSIPEDRWLPWPSCPAAWRVSCLVVAECSLLVDCEIATLFLSL